MTTGKRFRTYQGLEKILPEVKSVLRDVSPNSIPPVEKKTMRIMEQLSEFATDYCLILKMTNKIIGYLYGLEAKDEEGQRILSEYRSRISNLKSTCKKHIGRIDLFLLEERVSCGYVCDEEFKIRKSSLYYALNDRARK